MITGISPALRTVPMTFLKPTSRERHGLTTKLTSGTGARGQLRAPEGSVDRQGDSGPATNEGVELPWQETIRVGKQRVTVS